MGPVTIKNQHDIDGVIALDTTDQSLISLLQAGLPLAERPYAVLAGRIGISETEVLDRISTYLARGLIKRFGIIVRHHELGYKANAMVVWNVPDEQVHFIAHRMKQFPLVTLCYRRPRRLPHWPYNLYCMIHGRDRESVMQYLDTMIRAGNWQQYSYDVLFSKRRFKQRGARYQFPDRIKNNSDMTTKDMDIVYT
jgi:siroheme decarboxylase